jgi:mRNA-degrading endonuclease RelE of RelBE toxin-antitoxin system
MRLEKRYTNFAELKKHLTSNKADTLTFYVDQLLLKANTAQQLLDKINEVKKTKFTQSNDFKNLSIVKKHIRYRQNHNRVIFSVNKKNQIRMINVDYESENAQEKLSY